MKIVFIILTVIVAMISILLLVALFIKNEYSIKREIAISRPAKDVYGFIKYQKNQEQYSKWVMADPNMKKEFTGTDGSIGFVYAWDSEDKNVGIGEQEIIKLIEGERVDAEIRFIKPFEGVAQTSMIIESESENQVKVIWVMNGRNSYPMNLMVPFIDGMLGTDLELSLANLKTILEK